MVTNNSCNFGTGTAGQVLTSNGVGVSPTFQAYPAAAGLPSIPEWMNVSSSLWWSPLPYTAVTGGTNSAFYTIYFLYFAAQGAFTLTGVGVTVQEVFLNGTAAFALYSISGGGAGTLVATLGSISISTTGFISLTGLSQSVSEGAYYIAFQPQTVIANYNYTSGTNQEAVVKKADTGTIISELAYLKATSGFPSTVTTGNLGTLTGSSIIILMQGN